MRERAGCEAAEHALQRAVAGALPDDRALDEALAHVAACPVCGLRFEVAVARSYAERRDTLPAVADVPVDPSALFERALTAALAEPDTIARRRAAERLGERDRLAPAALAALVKAAADDRDGRVRAAALNALGRLGEDVLTARSGAEARTSSLHGERTNDETEVWNTLAAESGSLGEIVRKGDQLWMKLNGLPASLERTKLAVAVPGALTAGEAELEWHGSAPGLVFARDAVARGALEVLLGEVPDPVSTRALAERLFARVYLLSPREQGEV